VKIDWKKEIKLPRPSLSWLRRSSLKRPKALSAGPSIKLPRPVADLYSDLRDRHLLPLVALLIVGIIAAPILLNKSSDDKTPPPVASAGVSATATSSSSFTVVPAARRLRSPGKRLAHRQPLDPFRVEQQKQKAHGGKSGAQESHTGTGGSSSGAGTTTESVTPIVPVESAPIEGATTPTEAQPPRHAEIKIKETPTGDKEVTIKESTSNSGSGSEAGSSGNASEGTSTTPESSGGQTAVVSYTVDLKTGDPEADLTESNEVAPMTKLPTAKNPLVVFVGLSQDNKSALFLMTSKVTAYYGAVHCVVDAQACQLVELKPGHAALFEYISGETEAKYKVVLEKIEPVVHSQGSTEPGAGKTASGTVSERPAEAQPQQPSPRADALGAARRFSK
jgi:hypothetical protein